MFRILAVERDPERGRNLQQLMRGRVNAELVFAASPDAAMASISEQVPDLILTSALMTPSDDAQLTEHLKASPHGRDLPVLTLPPLIDPDEKPPVSWTGPIVRFRRRGMPPWPAYDPEALGHRIEEALKDAQSARIAARLAGQAVRSLTRAAIASANSWEETLTPEDRVLSQSGLGVKRLRAHRWGLTDLPWLSNVMLPWGLEVQLLNISSSGLLIESGSKFIPGSEIAFHLSGSNKNLVVPARIVRSQVATVDNLGVKYRAAAVFDKDLDLLTQRPATLKRCISTPKALAHLLAGVVDQLEQGAGPAELRATFEQGLRRLVSAREIEIRDMPSASDAGCDSVYFAVPTDRGFPTILQATFEPSYEPQEEEFRILKAAATLAGFILQFEDIAPDRTPLVMPLPLPGVIA